MKGTLPLFRRKSGPQATMESLKEQSKASNNNTQASPYSAPFFYLVQFYHLTCLKCFERAFGAQLLTPKHLANLEPFPSLPSLLSLSWDGTTSAPSVSSVLPNNCSKPSVSPDYHAGSMQSAKYHQHRFLFDHYSNASTFGRVQENPARCFDPQT